MILDQYVKPVSDSVSVYDPATHRWVLSLDEGKKIYNPLNGDAYVQKRLKKASDSTYRRFYYGFVASFNKNIAEWVISCTPEGKAAMLDALRAQAEYDEDSGGLSVASQAGVDSASGLVIDREAVKAAILSPEAESILQYLVCYGIMITASFDIGIRLPEDRYPRWVY